MIKPSAIQQRARQVGVRDQQIEKDYIISWILKGLSAHDQLSKTLVFKGGTVLKKFYFAAYRFSEDLDFTLLPNQATDEQLFARFNASFDYIRKEANIPLGIVDNNEHEDGGINFYISYIGPLGGQGTNKRVKVDISKSEQLEFAPVSLPAFVDYTDLEPYNLLCYAIEEVLIEKLRSVMQRMAARDFYDIWFLLLQHGMDANFYLQSFKDKCVNKGLNPKNFAQKLAERLPQYKGRWKSSMTEQIKDLPEFEQVEREVQRALKTFIKSLS